MLKNKKNYFVDVVIIRLSLIFLLVFYHSFAIYSRNWSSPFSFVPDISIYYWLSVCTHGFQLEAMTFISGLLLGYTIKTASRASEFPWMCDKKDKTYIITMLYIFIYLLSNI